MVKRTITKRDEKGNLIPILTANGQPVLDRNNKPSFQTMTEEVPQETLKAQQQAGQNFINQREAIALQQGISSRAAQKIQTQMIENTPEFKAQQQANALQEEVNRLNQTQPQQTIPQQVPAQTPDLSKVSPDLSPQDMEKLKGKTLLTPEQEKALVNVGITGPIDVAGALVSLGGAGIIGAGGAPVTSGISSAGTAGTIAKTLSFAKSIKGIATLGAVGTLIIRGAGTAGSILTESKTQKEGIIKDLTDNRITYSKALEDFGIIDQNIESAESTAKLLSMADLAGFLGLKDTLTKFQYYRLREEQNFNQRLSTAELERINNLAKNNLGVQ